MVIHKGISVPNTPGTVDSDYRGEIKVPIINLSNEIQVLLSGDRIAQMVIAQYEKITWVNANAISDTERGTDGFGSTGITD
jgi:dUTP pyrophosphatase